MIKTITGLDDIQISAVAGDFLHKKSPALFVVSSLPKAKELALDFSFFMPKKDVFILPDEDPFFLQFEARSSDRVHDRCIAIASMIQARDAIYIAPINAVLKKIMPIGSYSSYVISFTKEKEIDLADVRNKLVVAGYQRVSMVELQGQWALRGDILDIFPVGFDDPVRIDLFDTTVERIRRFDPVTQRSLHGEIDKLSVYPAEQLLIDDASARDAKQGIHDAYTQAMKRGNDLSYELSKKLETLISYIDNRDNYQLLENYIHYFYHKPQTLLDYLVMPLTSNADIFILDPEHINNVLTLRRKESSEDFEALLMKGHAIAEDFQSYPEAETVEQFFEQYEKQWRVAKKNVANIYNISQFSEQKNAINYIVKHPIKMLGNLSILEDELKRYLDSGFETTIVYSAEDKEKSLGEFLSQRGLKGKVKLRQGSLVEGIELTDQKKVYLWEGDIFKTYKRRRRRISSEHTQQIQSFTDIKSGDFVVHETHGIGKYLGVNTLTVQGVTRDFLKIAYAGTDILYVPVDQMSLVQKYIGGGEHLPRVSNLSTDTWKRTKAKVKEDAYKMAEELIELSAKRMSRKGFAFSPDTVWQHDFEEAFPYEETNDQLRAISSIKSDMERPIPMDRLICGDVGYGKTEVAMRGVFKCVSDSKQAAILVPTTILAGQHYETFKKRFKDYPFRVEVISRFKTPEQQKKIIKDLKAGAVDVIIGTHRLISKDIEYHDLGLLVIDEEQRFGVAHKEKIKHMKEDVDVITLSATPIPRTLNMSLVGVRDMDLIEEPPEDRYPVQTYVVPETDDILGETIRREIERDGQVFVVVPRISGIARVAETIKALLPEARVAVGHGRLGPQNLEDIMLDFIDGQIDVLIATTIVESGLDIP
ncbi:MAG: DEAD/DEAH box helicase, partial [Clostridiales Family XIII bacterium]|nr:DEAD/DEAH box helicase [Clostridiales Family XIII bacterium]